MGGLLGLRVCSDKICFGKKDMTTLDTDTIDTKEEILKLKCVQVIKEYKNYSNEGITNYSCVCMYVTLETTHVYVCMYVTLETNSSLLINDYYSH